MLFLHLLVRFCFKKYHCVLPNILLETSPFIVTPSTKLPSSSALSPPSSSLSSLSSSSSIWTSPWSSSLSSSSSPLWLNPPSSSCSVLFYISSISEICASPSYLNSSVFFLTNCFLYCLLVLDVIFCWKTFILTFCY